jgi:hypothetical protein
MKPKKQAIPSIYDEKQFKKAGLRVNKLYLIGILLLLLVVFRFLNLTLWWVVNHLELNQKTAGKEVKYTSLHLSSYEKAKEKCLDFSRAPPKTDVTVVSYFNLFQPGIFLIHNTAKFSAVDLGRMVVPLGPGLFTLKMHLSGVVEKQGEQGRQQGYFGNSLLAKFFIKESQAAGDLSFINVPLEKSTYLKIPYLVYFYLPLVLILLFASIFSQAVLTGFFYYTGLFLLFDFKALFFTVPFGWFTRAIGIKDTTSFEGLVAVIAAVLLTMIGVLGLLNWKERRGIFKENLLVLLFLLLPLFLRF